MLALYRYRAYLTPGQQNTLARSFGCARVVFDDALRTRDGAHQAGEKISDTEVQRRVITLAKTTPDWERLGEIASVAGVQPCQDARRAYRNWPDRRRTAALNESIEGRKVAAGLAETVNPCGVDVRSGPVPAVGSDTGTHRSAT